MDDLFDTVVISTCCMDPDDKFDNKEMLSEEDDLGCGVWFLIFLVLMSGVYLFINFV